MEAELPRSGHSYFGIVSSAQEAHAILEASQLGLLPRVTRRLTDDERLRFVRPGAVFVWEEEEAGIRRWTDHIKWSPSRVSGAFLTYTEIPARGEETLVKQSFSSVDANGTKMHLIAYTSKSACANGLLPLAARDPLIQHMLALRTNSGRDPREKPAVPPPLPVAAPSAPQTPVVDGFPSHMPPFAPHPAAAQGYLHRSQSSLVDIGSATRPAGGAATEKTRPSTSTSEPRRSSSYDPWAGRPPSPSSRSLNQPTSTNNRRHPSPLLQPAPFDPSHPPQTSPRNWSFAYDPVRDGPPSTTSSVTQSRFPSLYSSPAPSPASVFTAPATTTASPFDPFPRHLPPLDGLEPAGLPASAGDSPPRFLSHGTFLDDFDDERRDQGRLSPRQNMRAAEDERVLRLFSSAP
ncbi:cAMP-independent regulatory protein pac2 [Rhodotorula toruloides]|uniref:BY PROTMAP: gi/472586335/gb/EMS23863.1/ cAMP-independent regulatory protein pac2 [Rhodosporidium toruloides NP11] gi/647397577/emb/CDR40712.1/ RHTO0S05e06524g1_1 [Rhodosporidium toruloides] n=1 Tax=Rhodotorula toruloides TaxID=5286 RepID=A0A0K3CSE3_RHOTO|nr:cAMP-independent regulatory protein pac2 [Rhodotorula toruloides]